jgi:hypothetical protein
METLLILILLVVVLDIASLRWGFNSTVQLNSPEWQRRVAWLVLENSDRSRRDISLDFFPLSPVPHTDYCCQTHLNFSAMAFDSTYYTWLAAISKT